MIMHFLICVMNYMNKFLNIGHFCISINCFYNGE